MRAVGNKRRVWTTSFYYHHCQHIRPNNIHVTKKKLFTRGYQFFAMKITNSSPGYLRHLCETERAEMSLKTSIFHLITNALIFFLTTVRLGRNYMSFKPNSTLLDVRTHSTFFLANNKAGKGFPQAIKMGRALFAIFFRG